jgi:hypothetical protein
MSSIAEIVEAPTDWLDALDPAVRPRVLLSRQTHLSLEEQVEMAVVGRLPSMSLEERRETPPSPGKRPPRPQPPPGPGLGARILNEVHDLLCSKETYEQERTNLLKEYRAGQATFVAGVTSVIAPHLGVGTETLSVGIAVVLSVVGQVGLKTWCAAQGERRRIADEQRREDRALYEVDLRGWREQYGSNVRGKRGNRER